MHQVDALRLLQGVNEHRAILRIAQNSQSGMCMADGWIVSHEQLDGDFDLDDGVVAELMSGSRLLQAAPTPPSSPSRVQRYLHSPSPTAAPGTLERFGQELPGATYGPGNLLGNSSAAIAGALQGLGERSGRALLAQGTQDILAGRRQSVRLSPNIELYNAANPRQRPRIRLRVRGLPLTRVQAMVPTTGGPASHWRVGGSGAVGSLRVQGMTAHQMHNTAVMVGENRLPGILRWTSGKVGGGVLAFAPSAALDAYNAIETDAQGNRSFNSRQFAVDSAKSQSGNAVGFIAGAAVTIGVGAVAGAAAAASAPVILVALGVGIVFQVAWNASGAADWAGQRAEEHLSR